MRSTSGGWRGSRLPSAHVPHACGGGGLGALSHPITQISYVLRGSDLRNCDMFLNTGRGGPFEPPPPKAPRSQYNNWGPFETYMAGGYPH